MNTTSHRYKLPILLHVSAWLLLGMMLFLLNPLSWLVALPDQFWITQGIRLLMLAGIFYLNEHLLVPKCLFNKGKSWEFLGIAVAIGLLLMLVIHQTEVWL